MTNYDRINAPRFKAGKQNGYLCSMCGQYTSLSDSCSCRGYNLVCDHCSWKMSSILDTHNIIKMIHDKGKLTEEEENCND